MTRAHILISGDVQGVGYRYFAKRIATQLGILGWVRNNYDGSVELDVEGEKNAIEEFIAKLKNEHPWARVDKVDVKWLQFSGVYNQFIIK